MSATIFDTVAHSACAMSFRTVQNASSRLTLVLCPSITIDRLTIEDFILIGPSLYPVMGVTDSVPREQQNTYFAWQFGLELHALIKANKAVARRSPEHCNASSVYARDPLTFDVKSSERSKRDDRSLITFLLSRIV